MMDILVHDAVKLHAVCTGWAIASVYRAHIEPTKTLKMTIIIINQSTRASTKQPEFSRAHSGHRYISHQSNNTS